MRYVTVTVEGAPYRLLAAATVSDLTRQLPEAMRAALLSGRAVLVDRLGNEVGEGGALSEGQAFSLVLRKGG